MKFRMKLNVSICFISNIKKKYEKIGRCKNIATIWQNNIKSGLFNEQELENSYSISESTKNMTI